MNYRRIVFSPLMYFVVSTIWIVFSDSILLKIIPDSDTLTVVQSIKGIIFVLISSAFFLNQRWSDETQTNDARIVLQSKSNQLKGLRKIDLSIISTQDLDEIIALVIDQIFEQLEPQGLRIHLMDMHSNQFVMHTNIGNVSPPPIESFPVGGDWAMMETQIIRMSALPNLRGDSSVYVITPLIGRKQVLGLVEVILSRDAGIMKEWVEYFEAVAGQLAIAIEHVQVIEQYEKVAREMSDAQEQLLKGWAKAMEYKDRETKGHSDRVTVLTEKMGVALGLERDTIECMIRGAYLHDIGKMAIPDNVLLKEGALTDEEWAMMKQHPLHAREFLDGIGFLNDAMIIPLYHHERWDGTGYPYGLAREDIPLPARIFAIADVWDALTHDRPYRSAWEEAEAREYIQKLAGEKFDPRLVEKFFKIMDHDVPSSP